MRQNLSIYVWAIINNNENGAWSGESDEDKYNVSSGSGILIHFGLFAYMTLECLAIAS